MYIRMIKRLPDIIKNASRNLRKNMTLAEKLLWEKLKARKLEGIKFDRQIPIYVFTENSWLDRYVIADFISKEYKVIIELDWSIHDLKEIYELDKTKEELLKNIWYKILRFKNNDILSNIQKILTEIVSSFPRRGREFKWEG